MKGDDDLAEDAVRYLANFHAVAGITCLFGSLILTIPGVDERLQSSSAPWLRAAIAPVLLVLSATFLALAYGGYRARPWGWMLVLAAYTGALGASVWLGTQGAWASWSAVPAAALIVLMLLTKAVRRSYGIIGSLP